MLYRCNFRLLILVFVSLRFAKKLIALAFVIKGLAAAAWDSYIDT